MSEKTEQRKREADLEFLAFVRSAPLDQLVTVRKHFKSFSWKRAAVERAIERALRRQEGAAAQ